MGFLHGGIAGGGPGEVLFCRANDDFSAYDIYQTRQEANPRWLLPIKPSFARSWSNADPHFSPDGRTLFFISNRPGEGKAGASKTYDIWAVSFESGRWGRPRRLEAPVSVPDADEWSPSVAANGNLYFGSYRPGGSGGLDLYVARWTNGTYQPPENLGPAINSAANEVEPWVAPDESYLIFSATGRPDSTGRYDLYLSRRKGSSWQRPEPLASVNTHPPASSTRACHPTDTGCTSAAPDHTTGHSANDSTRPGMSRTSPASATARETCIVSR